MSRGSVEIDPSLPSLMDMAPLIQLDLDATIPGTEGKTFAEELVCERFNPEEVLLKKDARRRVLEVFKKLTRREKQVILMQARGIDNAAIGRLLDMSRERTRQIGEDVRRIAAGLPRRERSGDNVERSGCLVCRKDMSRSRKRAIFCSPRCRHKHFRDKEKRDASSVLQSVR